MALSRPKPVVLAILDGWGIAPSGAGNAISQAKTPFINSAWKEYAHTQLIAHGESVGLPKAEPGNTETGHLNIGAGRIVYQDLPRINMSIADGSFFQNPQITGAIKHSQSNNSQLHIMGLVGGGGVHSDLTHLYALLRMCGEHRSKNVFLHLFTDGRDSPPSASMGYINQITTVLSKEGVGKIASVMGRYFAMDRDLRWDRTEKAYLCLTEGKGKTATTISEAIASAYAAKQTDEFIEPTVIVNENKQPLALIKENDAVIFYNFRIDRPRQLTKAFVLPHFSSQANQVGFDPYAVEYTKKHTVVSTAKGQKPFEREKLLKNLFFVTMTEYEADLPVHIAYPPQTVDETLGEVVSKYKLNQLRITESEKERFVTYYFNGQREVSLANEDREIVASPKVATYNLKPEMSSVELTDAIISRIKNNKYDLVIINYPNADMVGHTGNLKATIKGCEAVDAALTRLAQIVVDTLGGVMFVTADHGNAEEMINRSTGETDTEHNANPVPFIVIGTEFKTGKQLPQGILADIAPTILSLMNLSIPQAMSGRNLLASVTHN
jgi:2,3-bisphosphoglycerate-independent phosphoglycerate mutase